DEDEYLDEDQYLDDDEYLDEDQYLDEDEHLDEDQYLDEDEHLDDEHLDEDEDEDEYLDDHDEYLDEAEHEEVEALLAEHGIDLDGLAECVDADDWTPTAAEIEAYNAETAALAAFLAEEGYDVTIETDDELGLDHLDLDPLLDDLSEPELDALLEAFCQEQLGGHEADDVDG
ncbi:MAG: hypothetical protein AAGK32_06070, partial [Actinomycetota bacterium]